MLLGIAGYKRSGKDTMGLYLAQKYGFHCHSFAQPIKEMAKLSFHLTEEQVNGDLKEKMDRRYPLRGLDPRDGSQMTRIRHAHPVGQTVSERDELRWWQAKDGEEYPRFLTPRLIMTSSGTEWGRRLYGNVWVDSGLTRVRMTEGDNHCFTDVRFRNEVQAIQDAGGLVARLKRGELASTHQSERELFEMGDSEFDIPIDNRGTLLEFYAYIDHIMPALLKDRPRPS